MRTACTHNRRTNRYIFRKLCFLRLFSQYLFSDDRLGYLAHKTESILSVNVKSYLFAMSFKNVVKLLYYINRFALGGKILDYLFGKRIYYSQLKI